MYVSRSLQWVGWLTGVAVLLGIAGMIVIAINLFLLSGACITETKQKISNLSGFDIEMSETDCSTLGEDAAVSVFIAKTGEKRKTLLFKYGPASYMSLLPTISLPTPDVLLIAVPEVSDVIFQMEKWRNLSIDYDIGLISYPLGNEKRTPQH